jgi:hypothetical protein
MNTPNIKPTQTSRAAQVLVIAAAIVVFAALMALRSEISSTMVRALVAGAAFAQLAGALAWSKFWR